MRHWIIGNWHMYKFNCICSLTFPPLTSKQRQLGTHSVLHVLNYEVAIYISRSSTRWRFDATVASQPCIWGCARAEKKQNIENCSNISFICMTSFKESFIVTCQICKNKLKTDYKLVFCFWERGSIVWPTRNSNQSFSQHKEYARFFLFLGAYEHTHKHIALQLSLRLNR